MPDPKSRLTGLTEEELSEWQQMIERRTTMFIYMKRLRNRLALTRASDARKRALLKKHQYQMFYGENEGRYCIGCGMIQGIDCKPDCALAAELKEGG